MDVTFCKSDLDTLTMAEKDDCFVGDGRLEGVSSLFSLGEENDALLSIIFGERMVLVGLLVSI